MKSNIEFLKESIAKAEKDPESWVDEVYEFLDAVEGELKAKDKIISDLRQEVKDYEETVDIEEHGLETIDCGIGIIEYRTGNLKLQLLMEDFKSQQEKVIYQ